MKCTSSNYKLTLRDLCGAGHCRDFPLSGREEQFEKVSTTLANHCLKYLRLKERERKKEREREERKCRERERWLL